MGMSARRIAGLIWTNLACVGRIISYFWRLSSVLTFLSTFGVGYVRNNAVHRFRALLPSPMGHTQAPYSRRNRHVTAVSTKARKDQL